MLKPQSLLCVCMCVTVCYMTCSIFAQTAFVRLTEKPRWGRRSGSYWWFLSWAHWLTCGRYTVLKEVWTLLLCGPWTENTFTPGFITSLSQFYSCFFNPILTHFLSALLAPGLLYLPYPFILFPRWMPLAPHRLAVSASQWCVTFQLFFSCFLSNVSLLKMTQYRWLWWVYV